MEVKTISSVDEVTDIEQEGTWFPVLTPGGPGKVNPETVRSGLLVFRTGEGAPVGNPIEAGIFYHDTKNDKIYLSVNAEENGWKEISVNDEV